MGVFVFLALVVFALYYVPDVTVVLIVVNVLIVVVAVVTFTAAVRRRQRDRLVAGVELSSRPARFAKGLLALSTVMVLLGVGSFTLIPLWRTLHPGLRTGNSASLQDNFGHQDPASAAPSAQADVPVTSGVLFDDFHYSGRNDPALAAHGWKIHHAAGGPGIDGTWSPEGVSFPTVAGAKGGQVLQLQLHTDGTRAGTRQAGLQSSKSLFLDGTYAARVYITDDPAVGGNGDHVNETFYAISPQGPKLPYSELDYEYLPNGGWGSPVPELDAVSWHSAKMGDRVYRGWKTRLHGWHTLVFTTLHGKTTYSVDGQAIFSNGAAFSPRSPMNVNFSLWLIDLPFSGNRDWNMQVNWFYFQAGKAQSLSQVQKAVDGYYASGTDYANTLATP